MQSLKALASAPSGEANSKPDGIPGVNGAVDPLRPIPNSIVKRCSGEDSEGVGLCQNSSMPGSILKRRSPLI